jgi:hypothetical protein
VRLRATVADGSYDQRSVAVTAAAKSEAAPTAYLPQTVGGPTVAAPVPMAVGRELVVSTVTALPGRVRVTAFVGSRRLGSCSALTPAGRSFTCRLAAHGIPDGAPIRIVASLRAGTRVYSSARPAAAVAPMSMLAAPAGAGRWQFICSPAAIAGGGAL